MLTVQRKGSVQCFVCALRFSCNFYHGVGGHEFFRLGKNTIHSFFIFYIQDFTVTILLHLRWHDGRYTNEIKGVSEGYVEIDAKNLEKLWVPDLYFPNEKNAYYHNVLMPNKMMRIYKEGDVTYSTR